MSTVVAHVRLVVPEEWDDELLHNPTEVGPVIDSIAVEMENGSMSGKLADWGGLGDVEWSFEPPMPGVNIDRRQRQAAAILLMAFDLPEEMSAVAASMKEASTVCPGLTTADMAALEAGKQGRRRSLEAARRLIDAMLEEIV